MLNTTKKSFLLTLLTYSIVFPMRQIARVTLARSLNQSVSFHNSLAARCPFITAVAMLHMAEETTNTQARSMTANEFIANEPVDDPVATDHQNTATDNQVMSDLNKSDEIKNTQWYTNRHQKPIATNWQHSSSADIAHGRLSSNNDTKQRNESLSNVAFRIKLEQIEQTRFTNAKSQLSSSITEFATTVQNKVCRRVNSDPSLSHHETVAQKENLSKCLCALEDKLLSLTRQNPNTYFVLDVTRHGLNCESIFNPYHNQDKWTMKDVREISAALELKAEIESIKVAIQDCDTTIHRFEQEARDFASKLESASSDEIEQEILPNLIAKKENLTVSIVQKENELNYQNNKLEAINNQLELFSKRSTWAKLKEVIKRDHSQDLLMVQQSAAKAEQREIKQQLQCLYGKQNKHNTQIEHVQKIANEKKQVELQHAQLAKEKLDLEALQKQRKQQDTLIFSEQMVKNQYESCNFDPADCPEHELRMQWCDRQKALSKTKEQGYKQYGQEFHLTPQTVGFLAAHDLNYTEYQRFFGTALQQQLHGEMCDVLSQAATMQAQLPYQTNLLTSVVDFADAAYDANKREQVLLASRLIDVDWIVFRLSRGIATVAIPYAQAVVSGATHGAIDFLHMAADPIKTCKDLGKTICFALETAALNCIEDESMIPGSYALRRDQRNEEIAQAMNQLGHQMANSTGPQRLEALTRFGTFSYISGKITHAVSGVCGAARPQAKIIRNLESLLKNKRGIEKTAHDFVQIVQKIEQAVQDNVAQKIAKNLKNAEKQVTKPVKSLMHGSYEPVRTNKYGIIKERSFVEKKISALEKAQNSTAKVRELPDGRIRYYAKEDPSKTVGPTRGRSHVTEFNPTTNHVRQWEECYDHAGNVNRIHPKMLDGKNIDSFHYPLTKQDLEIIAQLIKEKK